MKAKMNRRTIAVTPKFRIHRGVLKRAAKAQDKGVCVLVGPKELLDLMDLADSALNGDSNDAEHDALYLIRESLSEWLEEPQRRATQRKRPSEKS